MSEATPGEFRIAYDTPRANGKTQGELTLFFGETIVHTDVGDLLRQGFRQKFARDCQRRFEAADVEVQAVSDDVDRLLLDKVEELRAARASKSTRSGGAPVRTILTQVANAQELVRRHGRTIRFNASAGRWMVYDGRRWIVDQTGQVCRFAKGVARSLFGQIDKHVDPREAAKHARDSERASGIAAMIKLAETEPRIPIVGENLDADGRLLNVLNGTVDLRTGRLGPHRPEHLISKLAPVRFNPRAACPMWERFLDRIMDGKTEMIDYLQRIAGLCLTGDATIQELFVFHGEGANGKSVWLDTIADLLGDYATEAPPSLITVRRQDEHATEIADLAGRRLVIASETEEGAKLRVQLVKRLTGNARLKGRFMREDFFEFPRTHKLILVTNNMPVIRETTNAIWRRVRLVPFTVTIPEEQRDTELLTKLRTEWPGILAWAVRGCSAYMTDGMQAPAAVDDATESYRAEQDPLAGWIGERCLIDPDGYMPRAESYPDYQQWARTTGERDPLQRNEFYEHLRKRSDVRDGWRKIKDVPTRVWEGIVSSNLGSQYAQAQDRLSQVTGGHIVTPP
jgi:putative DNA primase/helicase